MGSGGRGPSAPEARDRSAVTGGRAEEIAAKHLQARGYRIVARNWRRPEGELDLVADDGGVCVFVEVRSRTGREFGDPLESVTPRKRAQVIRAAQLYLYQEPRSMPASAYRFDVVGVTFPSEGGEPECVHVVDAFQTDG
jgi:putative endonuclease